MCRKCNSAKTLDTQKLQNNYFLRNSNIQIQWLSGKATASQSEGWVFDPLR